MGEINLLTTTRKVINRAVKVKKRTLEIATKEEVMRALVDPETIVVENREMEIKNQETEENKLNRIH